MKNKVNVGEEIQIYPFPQLLFHERFENIHHDVNVQRSIDVVHAFSADRIHILKSGRERSGFAAYKTRPTHGPTCQELTALRIIEGVICIACPRLTPFKSTMATTPVNEIPSSSRHIKSTIMFMTCNRAASYYSIKDLGAKA